ALLGLDRRQRRKPVAVKRGAFEFEIGRGLLHLLGEFLLHRAAVPGQKILGLAHEIAVAGKVDFARAWPRAALDLKQEARARAALEERVGAGADQEGALQRIDGATDGAGRGEWTKVAAAPRLRAAVF